MHRYSTKAILMIEKRFVSATSLAKQLFDVVTVYVSSPFFVSDNTVVSVVIDLTLRRWHFSVFDDFVHVSISGFSGIS